MKDIEKVLSTLSDEGLINSVDRHFSQLLCRLDSGGSPLLAALAALTSNATSKGHVCLELSSLESNGSIALSPKSQWSSMLHRSAVVGSEGEFKPLVLDEVRGRLYLYRYWDYEQRLAEYLNQRASREFVEIDEALLERGLQRYFPSSGENLIDWQKIAAVTALFRPLCVISGGPGTGKTTTVVKILALFLEQFQGGEKPRIALAAPTGKAAARMQESLRNVMRGISIPESVKALLPTEAKTLHRLLGTVPLSSRFRHHKNNPLSIDLLVIDEASMIDLALMTKTIAALPEHARVILLGDRDQLASVEAGAVMGSICGDMPGFSTEFASTVASLTGTDRSQLVGSSESPLADSVVALRHSFRFGRSGEIAQLAKAVNSGDSEVSLSLLNENRPEGELGWLLNRRDFFSIVVEKFSNYLMCIKNTAALTEVFSAFESFRVLCALRVGTSGVVRLNQEIERALSEAGVLDNQGESWYAGRPVLITRNDYALGLYNGDIGIVLPDQSGELKVCFLGRDGRTVMISPARLPSHESAFCMSVHKSQGSEFDQVLLVLPERDAPVLTRELIYTAITRARNRFEIYASAEVFRGAISKRIERNSGLFDRLWGAERVLNFTSDLSAKEEVNQLGFEGF